MSETKIMKQIQMALTNLGCRIFRNNTGSAWQGRVTHIKKPTAIKLSKGDVVIRQARPVKFGLCVGSSDLIGWTHLTITEDLIGCQAAIFTAIEVKDKHGRLTDQQENFLKVVRDSGGFAGVARSPDEAAEVIHRF